MAPPRRRVDRAGGLLHQRVVDDDHRALVLSRRRRAVLGLPGPSLVRDALGGRRVVQDERRDDGRLAHPHLVAEPAAAARLPVDHAEGGLVGALLDGHHEGQRLLLVRPERDRLDQPGRLGPLDRVDLLNLPEHLVARPARLVRWVRGGRGRRRRGGASGGGGGGGGTSRVLARLTLRAPPVRGVGRLAVCRPRGALGGGLIAAVAVAVGTLR